MCPIDEKVFKTLKEEGNQCVKDKNYKDALSKYSECLKINNKECAIYTNRQVLCHFSMSYVNIFDEKIIDWLIAEVLPHDSENLVYTVNCFKWVFFFF